MGIQEHKSTRAQVGKTSDGVCSCAPWPVGQDRPVLLCSNSGHLSKRRGQSTIEFAFGMIILGLMVFGLVQCFRWVMLDLAERRVDHDRILTDNNLSTEAQLNPNFHQIRKIDAVMPAAY